MKFGHDEIIYVQTYQQHIDIIKSWMWSASLVVAQCDFVPFI